MLKTDTRPPIPAVSAANSIFESLKKQLKQKSLLDQGESFLVIRVPTNGLCKRTVDLFNSCMSNLQSTYHNGTASTDVCDNSSHRANELSAGELHFTEIVRRVGVLLDEWLREQAKGEYAQYYSRLASQPIRVSRRYHTTPGTNSRLSVRLHYSAK